jgi:hypothetical protein
MRLRSLTAATATACALGGCGGGSDSPSNPGTPLKAEGVYAGTITRTITVNSPSTSQTNDLRLVILEDDAYWALYGFESAGVHYPAGLVNGRGASSAGTFTSGDARDYGFAVPPSGTVTATYAAGSSFSGSGADGTGSLRFSATGLPPAFYEYATAATLAAVQGHWTGRNLRWAATSLDISATGALSGAADGCSFTGTLAPRASGKNIYTATVTFGGPPCEAPGQSSTGIAMTSTLADGRHQIMIAGVIAAGTSGSLIVGTR